MNKTKLKKYSFDLVVPEGTKHEWIVVEAWDERSAKKKLLRKLSKINKQLIRVHEFDPEEGKLIK